MIKDDVIYRLNISKSCEESSESIISKFLEYFITLLIDFEFCCIYEKRKYAKYSTICELLLASICIDIYDSFNSYKALLWILIAQENILKI